VQGPAHAVLGRVAGRRPSGSVGAGGGGRWRLPVRTRVRPVYRPGTPPKPAARHYLVLIVFILLIVVALKC
jgi:hypothetical protein